MQIFDNFLTNSRFKNTMKTRELRTLHKRSQVALYENVDNE